MSAASPSLASEDRSPAIAADPGPGTMVRGGLALSQLAGVTAGLAEGLPLSEVLRHERVEASRWAGGAETWTSEIAADETGQLQEAMDAALALAQERYRRDVAPLSEDVDVWIDFVRTFAASASPMAFLARLGLRSPDLVRLHRAWGKRLVEDPAAREGAQRAMSREVRPLPALVLGERAMDPPPETPDLPAVESPSPPVDTAPSIAAESAPPKVEPAARVEPPPESVPPVTRPPTQISTPATPFAPAREPAAQPSFMQRPTAPPRPAETPQPPATPPAKPRGPAPQTMAFDLGKLAPHLVEELQKKILPFGQKPEGEQASSATAESVTQEAQPSPLAKAVLPFRPARRAESKATPPAAEEPPAGRPSALPGAPAVAPPHSAAPPHAAAPHLPAPPSAQGQPIGPGVTLTIEQHAALCAELAAFPRHSEAIFARYGLSDHTRRAAADRAWKARLEQNPAESAQWRAHYSRYYTHYRPRG